MSYTFSLANTSLAAPVIIEGNGDGKRWFKNVSPSNSIFGEKVVFTIGSPDGKYLVTLTNTSANVAYNVDFYDTATWNIVAYLNIDNHGWRDPETFLGTLEFMGAAFSPDSSKFVLHFYRNHEFPTGYQWYFIVYDAVTLVEDISNPTLDTLTELTRVYYSTASGYQTILRYKNPVFSPDGTLMACAEQASPRIHVFETTGWTEELGTPTVTANISCMTFSPDSTQLVMIASRFRVYAVSDWSEVSSVSTSVSSSALAFFDSGTKVLTYQSTTNYRFADATNWTAALTSITGLTVGTTCQDFQFSPDGKVLLVAQTTTSFEIIDTSGAYTAWASLGITPTLNWSSVQSINGVVFIANLDYGTISGTVRNRNATLSQRRVLALNRPKTADEAVYVIADTLSDDTTGAYELILPHAFRAYDVTRIVLAEEIADTGTATSATSTTLTDSAQTWTVNEWADHEAIIVAGTGVGQRRTISANTATELTITPSWTVTPDATSDYQIEVVYNDRATRVIPGVV